MLDWTASIMTSSTDAWEHLWPATLCCVTLARNMFLVSLYFVFLWRGKSQLYGDINIYAKYSVRYAPPNVDCHRMLFRRKNGIRIIHVKPFSHGLKHISLNQWPTSVDIIRGSCYNWTVFKTVISSHRPWWTEFSAFELSFQISWNLTVTVNSEWWEVIKHFCSWDIQSDTLQTFFCKTG